MKLSKHLLHSVIVISGHKEWRENEDLMDAIAENLYQVIKDNPDLFKKLIVEEPKG